MTETSRSPYAVSASVRGIGVAVMTSTSGLHAFLPQRRALQHAETMLLVDDDEPELLERHGLFSQRVRADDEVHGAARELRQHLPPPRRRQRCRSATRRESATLSSRRRIVR